MLLEALLTAVKWFISILLSVIHFPSIPERLEQILEEAKFADYLSDGVRIISAYTHFPFLSALFVVCLSIETFENMYKFIMWLLRKIPLLGIE